MDALFAELKALIEPYAKHFTVFEDTADTYDLEEELPGYRRQLTALSAGDRKALGGLIAAAWRTIAAIRELAEGRPYHRKLDLDATFALLKGVLVPYAKQFAVGIDQPHWYTLEQQTP